MQAEGQPVKYTVTTEGLEITGTRIVIKREVANAALGLDSLTQGEALIRWRSLYLNRTGSLLEASETQIVIADDEEKSDWSSVRVRRATKDLGEVWSDRMGMSQAQFYDEAVRAFIAQYHNSTTSSKPAPTPTS
jgi:hypothetical protein